ncbi:class I SAM-dependent methyltransferase [Amycolatopsis magusensis]|uniref:class I SAM-dependent methyltransferase n=1 Tax=Amycolatopsis magusensis TaxID=882444 RepID=UPI0024A9CDCD|nr:class I SAM-dependent methyltransferase [Amycolatopsis magusensis]MDI5975848.1 class I SAM-dependent methyltransferase [Amycolatopsis magusensis]
MRVDPSKVEQLSAWDGDQGAFWAERADRFDDGVAAYHDRFFEAAALQRTSAVLDVGCGTGQMTRAAARLAPEGHAWGVDLSSRMIELARERAAELPNVRFLQADAQVHPFPRHSFDVVISRHGAMFFGDAKAAFANLAAAVRPGGRLVLLTWQPSVRNEWVSTFRRIFSAGRESPASPPAPTPNPSSLGDPDQVRELLTAAGFTGVRSTGLSERMFFGRDVEDAAEFVEAQFGWMTRELPDEVQARVRADLRVDLAAHLGEHGVRYDSAAWLVEAST